ncbi:MAG: GxxExxY protein [Candidatus Liptonbacteria bacterium]|nr:GxxExxY protein [Candidatus Liptonbacteria bacterium]
MNSIPLDTPLAEFPHVPKRFLTHLSRLGIRTVRELLSHFPVRYEDFSAFRPISDLEVGERITIQAQVVSTESRRSWRRRFVVVEAELADASGSLRAVWFNQPYVAHSLRQGHWYNFSGKVGTNEEGDVYLNNPTYELTDRGQGPNGMQTDAEQYVDESGQPLSASSPQLSATRHTGRLVPIYPETKGLTSKGIRFLIHPLLDAIEPLWEFIPSQILEKENLLEVNDALRAVHFPLTLEDAARAKRRFAFEDLFLLQLSNLEQRMALQKETAPAVPASIERVKAFLETLPFPLTSSQKKSLWEILQDIREPHPMNRLLQGDVGSGKTVIAALTAFLAAEAGLQTAVMAPTEVLARQHYETFKKLIDTIRITVPVALLTSHETLIAHDGSLEQEKSKKKLLTAIQNGTIPIAIGTHALLSKAVTWHSLGLVVVDEQHRFGVRQRALLARGQTRNETRTDAESKLLYEDITFQIRECLFEVRKTLGLGHKENIYEKAIEEEFKRKGIYFEVEKSIPVKYGDKKVGVYRPDFVVSDKVILELKALPFVGQIEKKQIWNYLKGSPYKLALLANFGPEKLRIDRIIYDTARAIPPLSASGPQLSASLPHFLSMSATPIPRTLTLTVFGDLDLSTITELPPGRKPVKTHIVPPEKREKAYEFIRGQVQQGRQAFVICPRIQAPQTGAEETRTDAEKRPRLSASRPQLSAWDVRTVEEEYERLSAKIFLDLQVGMLHGKMKPVEKEAIMKEFREGNLDVLVSTTVIEVGVDVPNASIMMIEGSDRFGLAQLYQLRGRVGRGAHESYCFLFTDSDSKSTRERLKAITEAKNGFELAEKDLKLRGPGEFLGTSQTGFPDVAMEALTDPPLVSSTREAAKEILRADSELKKHPLLKKKLMEFERGLHLE